MSSVLNNQNGIPNIERRRQSETIVFNVTQTGNAMKVEGGAIRLDFEVEGIELPPGADASFAVWALLPRAMEGGFNLEVSRPIDPMVATNAETLTRIWEMWVPSRYRSISVSRTGEWSRSRKDRLPRADLYSGGVDSTYSLLKLADPENRGYALTIDGLDYHANWGETKFAKLIAKTDTLLEKLNYQRIIVRTNASHRPQGLTHGFTLASCLFLLSDLFEGGTLAADRTPAEDMVTFPWGTNHVTKSYFAGSDFAMQTVFETSRVEKLAAIGAGIGLPFLSFCRKPNRMPANCGRCSKCVRTKAMLMTVMGRIPDIFLDNTFDEQLVRSIKLDGRERTHVLSLYSYAKDRGLLDTIPGLLSLVEECRKINEGARARRNGD